MLMSRIFTVLLFLSLTAAVCHGSGRELASAVLQGAQQGVNLTISMTGAVCLWSGIGKLMETIGLTTMLSRFFRPLLSRIFPESKADPLLAGDLSANICANILGLGNAATPMGIQAAQKMAVGTGGIAGNELCRLVVLNTASIQLIPATVAALRASLGCSAPFDILPAVWVTSICSAGMGLIAAWLFGKLWRRD